MDRLSFREIKKYTQHLQKNHLDDFVKENIRLAKEYSLPANKIIFSWSEKEVYDFIKERTNIFFSFFKEENPLEFSLKELQKWKTDDIPKVSGKILTIEDLVFSYSIRKEVLIKLLPLYTKDIHINNCIILEFEAFYREWMKEALNLLWELQNDILLDKIDENTQELSHKNEELQKAKERFEIIANATNDVIWDWDIKENHLEQSSRIYSYFGYSDKDVDNKLDWWIERIHPEDRNRIGKEIHDVLHGVQKAWDHEYRFLRKDGTYAYICNKGYGVKDATGNIYRIIGAVSDVSTRKETEDALRNSEARFRFLAESIPQIVWTANPDGKVDYINQRWLDYTGQSKKEAYGFGWTKAIHSEEQEEMKNAWKYSLKTGSPLNVEHRLKKKDNSYRWFLARSVPFRDKHNTIVKWFGTTTDINDQIRDQEKLEKVNEELKRINSDLDNFIYTASHDLKAPVSNIEGLINTLKDTLHSEVPDAGDQEHILELIEQSILRFKGTIQDLTEITKVQRNIFGQLEEVNIQEIIEDVKNSIADLIESAEAQISVDLDGCKSIRYSKVNLKSIIYNLISNAIKYRAPNRKALVSISCKKDKNYLVLRVKDNGLGISAENRSKLFSMFKRFHDHVEGSGIGLYIVKRIIDNSGGKIEVESEPGKGTTFKVYLKMDPFPNIIHPSVVANTSESSLR